MMISNELVQRILIAQSKKYSRRGLYEFLEDICSELPCNLKVLNVGAGGEVETLLKNHARKKNWELLSLDIDPSRKPNILGSIEDIRLPNDSFNVVFMIEVLEHVQDVTTALTNTKQILLPNGSIVASVPFMLPIHDAPNDFYRFTEFGLQHIFSKFKNVDISARNGYFESCAVIAMRSLVTSRGRDWLVLLVASITIFLVAPLARVIDKVCPIKESTTGYTVYCTC